VFTIRPYRYPIKQMDVIEKLVNEMLGSGVIHPIPIALMGKIDGSWRMCMDYGELNKQTIEDKFPILVVKELVNELAGAITFSKIDLRFRYQMCADNIHKTTF